MPVNINFLLLVALGIYILATEYSRYSRNSNNFDCKFFVTAWFFFSYVLTPLVIELYSDEFDLLIIRGYPYVNKTVLSLACIANIYIFWFAFIFGNKLISNNFVYREKPKICYSGIISHCKELLFFGLVFLVGFFYCYGFSAVYTNIRFGELENSQIGFFFKSMSSVIVIAFFFLVVFFLGKGNKFKFYDIPLIALIILISLYLSVQGGGRGAMIKPFLFSFLVYCKYKNRIKINLIFICLVLIMIFFILYGRFVFAYFLFQGDLGGMNFALKERLSSSNFESLLLEFIYSFAFDYISLDTAIDTIQSGQMDYRYFKDIPLGVFFYLRLIGIEVDYTITYFNTYFITGRFLSHVPPGIVGLGYYSFGYLGVLVLGLLFGLLVKTVDNFFIAKNNINYETVYYLSLSMLIGNFVSNGEPRLLVLKSMPILLGLFLLFRKKGVCNENTSHNNRFKSRWS